MMCTCAWQSKVNLCRCYCVSGTQCKRHLNIDSTICLRTHISRSAWAKPARSSVNSTAPFHPRAIPSYRPFLLLVCVFLRTPVQPHLVSRFGTSLGTSFYATGGSPCRNLDPKRCVLGNPVVIRHFERVRKKPCPEIDSTTVQCSPAFLFDLSIFRHPVVIRFRTVFVR